MIKKIGLGGGCHWCTEAVFASLKGVKEVQQGWIASLPPYDSFSEAVVITYDDDVILLRDLTEVHLLTHSSMSLHSMRDKYRSAIYYFDEESKAEAETILNELQAGFEQPVITQIMPFASFKASLPEHRKYYYANPEKPFCTVYIHPKLQMLRKKFSNLLNKE